MRVMMVFTFWLIGVALVVIQTTILPSLPLWLGRPDFLFILVVFIAYRFAWIPGIGLVFTLGWLLDVVAGIYLGLYPLLCIVTFTVLKLLTSRSPIKESTYQIPLVGVSYFLVQMLLYFVYSLALGENLSEWSWGITVQRSAVLVAASVPLFLLFGSLQEYLQKRRLLARPHRRHPRKQVK